MRRRWPLAVGMTALAALGGWTLWSAAVPPSADLSLVPAVAAEPARPGEPATAALETIAPGTAVEPTDHPGWSHLVLKSRPRIRPDQRNKVNDLTARMAGWMITAFMADVRPNKAPGGPRFVLRSVGLGLGTAIKGKDTVVTPDTAAKLGADVGFVTRTILTKGYERQKTSGVASSGPTMWLVDTPVFFADRGRHRLVRYRYALLADGETGKLETVVWRLDGNGGVAGKSPEAVRLDPEGVEDADLVVDAREISRLGIPSEAAFAVDTLPVCGKPVALPADLLKLAGKERVSAADAAAIEAALRRLPATR